VISLVRQAVPPAVDGRLDDWQGETFDLATLAAGADQWSGPADLSARAFLAWDDTALHVGVRVTDDVYTQAGTGPTLNQGDSVELQLDTDLAGDFTDGAYSADDWLLGLSAGNFADHPAEAVVWRPAGVLASGAVVAGRRLPAGYIVEASLPWALLAISPRDRDRIGLALSVLDADGPGQAPLTIVSSVPERSATDPRTFGTLILSH
jgi:hypothetical protein